MKIICLKYLNKNANAYHGFGTQKGNKRMFREREFMVGNQKQRKIIVQHSTCIYLT